MFSLKSLTKKFNKQSLNEVKPAPLSETVDHTLNSSPPTANITPASIVTPSLSASSNALPTFPPSPSISSTASSITPEEPVHIHHFTRQPSNSSSPNIASIAGSSVNCTSFPSPPATLSTSSFSPLSSASSDSEDEEEEQPSCRRSPSFRIKAHPHSPRKVRLPSTQLKIERISSAEKRKYSQFKGSTGSNSSPSSSDDEVKEAFETSAVSSCRHLWNRTPNSHSYAWAQATPTSCSSSFSSSSSDEKQQRQRFNNSWSIGQFDACTNRPLKVVPVGNKHKFFAQMSTKFSSERPFLDFKKMQHSKRVVMVRRPMVIRNHSKVHSIQRPPSLCPHVSLDISQNSFQPVLTQT